MASPTPTAHVPMSHSAPAAVASPHRVRSRTQSISSDRPSTVGLGLGLTAPPLSVSPEPAFMAASAAAQIVTHDHDSHADAWYDQNGVEPAGETAVVAPAALQLANGFLDQLLFNFLQVARATTLSALRPAVSEILKPKLAKDTIGNADQELREYLGGADEDDYLHPHPAPAPPRDWDLELAWKRTRLRCMVYSSLGDMEEEDEDLYMEQENLEIGANEQASDLISPAVAIFLTSVLEYMGELTLTVAGQAAYSRVRAKIEKDLRDGTRCPSEVADRIVVDDMDMERVALDRTLGRLWRGWKKRMRSPGCDLAGRPFSRGSLGHQRQESAVLEGVRPATGDSAASESRKSQHHAAHAMAQLVDPASIPLPQSDNDVDEIEVPGLAYNSDDEQDDEAEGQPRIVPPRPRSLFIQPPLMVNGLPTPTLSQPDTPVATTRKRANSLPTPVVSPFLASRRPRKPSQDSRRQDSQGPEPQLPQEPSQKEAPETEEEETANARAASPPDGKASAAAKRRSKLLSGAALAGASAATAAAAAAFAHSKDGDHGPSKYQGPDGAVATYEKAEILTSSRVSISGSSTSAVSISEHGRAAAVRRSSSVHSARIIDVPGPRSPTHSRPTSVDATERARFSGPPAVTTPSRASAADDERRLGAAGYGPGSPARLSPSRSPADKRKSPTRQPAVPIAETEEHSDDYPTVPTRRSSEPESPEPAGPARAGPATGSGEPCAGSRVKAAPAAASKKSSATRREHAPSHIKVTASRGSSGTTASFLDETIPELPQKSAGSPGWQSPKTDGRGTTPIERSRTKETTDDELVLPVQSNVTPRQIHTSASSGSSGTSRLKPVRTSEDNSSRAESVARNFEELIQSNQTITYTLTPENMRDIDAKRSLDSPVVTKFPRKGDDVRGQQSPRSSPTAPEAPKSPTTFHPISPSSPRTGESKATKAPGPAPRSPAGAGAQARDARTNGESMADFAQFIKSTGPPGEKSPVPPRKVRTPTSPTKASTGPAAPSTTSSRGRYQPRDATVDRKADNSDLIDFIRQGPPIAASNHRIPRHVAPFRSTMDSDQMVGAVGGKAIDATLPEIRYSQGSNNLTDNSMPSLHSSINSSSALLKNKGAAGSTKATFDEEGLVPKRKQRRVRDPYAIDLSDEEELEDDDVVATPKPPPKKEESLAEFLRNYEPPPEPASPAPRLPRKKSSAPSLMGRFTRSGSKDANSAAGLAKGAVGARQDARSLNSRGGGKGGYIPLQVNMPPGYDMYLPVESGAAARPHEPSSAAAGLASSGRLGAGSAASSGSRVPMKKFEPREAIINRSQTSDLAAFLRDSAPPPSAVREGSAAALGPLRQEESNAISKVFGRRKKAGAL